MLQAASRAFGRARRAHGTPSPARPGVSAPLLCISSTTPTSSLSKGGPEKPRASSEKKWPAELTLCRASHTLKFRSPNVAFSASVLRRCLTVICHRSVSPPAKQENPDTALNVPVRLPCGGCGHEPLATEGKTGARLAPSRVAPRRSVRRIRPGCRGTASRITSVGWTVRPSKGSTSGRRSTCR